ncbi:MAG: NAD(P)/FAD-dependent oxidoreductase [Bradyrhizobium sp.]
MKTDVLIIGAGPVGLFAIFACGQLDLACIVVDSLEQPGGQCISLYPEKPIYDIPGRRTIGASELVDELVAQAAPYKPQYVLGDCVISISGDAKEGWSVRTQKGVVIACRAVIIAGGNGLFEPVRPALDGLADYEGRSVFYAVRNREELAGKHLVIAGGGDSALDWALSLSSLSARCYLVHRRPRFRAAPATTKLLGELVASGSIEVLAPAHLQGLQGDGGLLSGVNVRIGSEERLLKADVLLPFYGMKTDLGPLASWGLDMHEGKIVVEPGTSSTNRPGIFAIGDIAHYFGKLGLILTGFAEAAQAAHAAHGFVRPEVVLNFVHSTSRGDPALATA